MAIVMVAVGAGVVVEVGSAAAVEVEGLAVEAEVVDGGSVAVEVVVVEALVMVTGSGRRPLHRATATAVYRYILINKALIGRWLNIVYNVLLLIV